MERRRTEPQGSMSEAAFLRELAEAARAERAATMHYTHAAILAAASTPAAARLFDELARVELSHYEELGQLLLFLDKSLPPSLQGAWQSVFFAKDPHTGQKKPQDTSAFLRNAIEIEQSTAKSYRHLAEKTREDTAHKLLLRLAAEETEHATALNAMQERMARS
ncbi:MAG: hypothetical protein IJC99_03835 [Clostridia bacterium]|nr:hypothetical protein [Clostridia bacterium]